MFSVVAASIYIPTGITGGLHFSKSLQRLLVVFLIIAILAGVR